MIIYLSNFLFVFFVFIFSAVDCDVSPWSSWSGCSERCGIGYRERRRFILDEPQNAGAECPKLRELRGCKGYRGCEVEDEPGNSMHLI